MVIHNAMIANRNTTMSFTVTMYSSYVEELYREDYVRYHVKLATVNYDIDLMLNSSHLYNLFHQ